MEQIITLKVDLEYPDAAHHAIDEAVKAYEADKLKWTTDELAEAKHLAMQIMTQLCLDGYNISWCKVESYGLHTIGVRLESEEGKRTDHQQIQVEPLDCQVCLSVPGYRQGRARVHHQKGW